MRNGQLSFQHETKARLRFPVIDPVFRHASSPCGSPAPMLIPGSPPALPSDAPSDSYQTNPFNQKRK